MCYIRRFGRTRPVSTVWLALAAVMLAGCPVQLAPDFDSAIVDGLTSANEKTLVLFAAVAGGDGQGGFEKHENTYNELIGAFDALRLQAQSRPDPTTPSLAGLASDRLPALADIVQLDTPTPDILANIVTTLTQMRNNHRDQGLSAGAVLLFKESYDTKMDQALTYEKALER